MTPGGHDIDGSELSALTKRAPPRCLVLIALNRRTPCMPAARPVCAACDGWSGLASMSPWMSWSTPKNPYGTGYVWLKGSLVARRNLQILFHELGHNNYLAHANAADDPSNNYNGETKDLSCAMAYGGGLVCFNAVHNWQVRLARAWQAACTLAACMHMCTYVRSWHVAASRQAGLFLPQPAGLLCSWAYT